jgi:predicted small lipoprotein YifL
MTFTRSRRLGCGAPAGALLAALAALGGCGQRGPLTLPDSARPIERLDPAAEPAPPASASDSEQQDDEERGENER